MLSTGLSLTSTALKASGGWWNSAAYRAIDTADGVSKGPAAIADFRRWRFALPALGPELVTNGGFDTGSGWSLSSSEMSISGGVMSWAAVAQYNTARHSVPLVVGKAYSVTYTILSGGSVYSQLGPYPNNSDGVWRATPGTYTDVLIAKTGAAAVCLAAGGSPTTATIDNVSVKEVLTNGQMRPATFDEWFAFTSAGGTYIDATGTLKTAGANTPRRDWTNGVGQLMLNNASTNLYTYSQVSSSGFYAGNVSFTTNNALAPDGTLTSTRVIANSGMIGYVDNLIINNISFTSGTTYTLSMFVAPAGMTSFVTLVYKELVGNTTNATAVINLSSGTSLLV